MHKVSFYSLVGLSHLPTACAVKLHIYYKSTTLSTFCIYYCLSLIIIIGSQINFLLQLQCVVNTNYKLQISMQGNEQCLATEFVISNLQMIAEFMADGERILELTMFLPCIYHIKTLLLYNSFFLILKCNVLAKHKLPFNILWLAFLLYLIL